MTSRLFILFTTLFLYNCSNIFSDEVSNKLEISNQEKLQKEEIQESANQENDNEESQLELLDQIEAEVTYLGSENLESSIITKQEVVRRGFDGNIYNVEDLENQNLADQFSKILKANITNDDINRNLKRNGMTEQDICDIAQKWGYINKDEFFEDLKKIYRANAALNYEIESNLVSSQEDIKTYYEQHLDDYRQEAKYIVETAFVQYKDDKDKEKIKNELESYLRLDTSKPEYLNWDFPVEINQDEISHDNDFLVNLKVGCMYMQEAPSGFVLYRMKDKFPPRVLPIESVQESIVVKLKKEEYQEVIEKIRNKLRAQAIIVHPTDQSQLCS